ncbi:hypothetical protein GGX14DRAFT_611536 [Mycena pura]|uniref:Uncharacterized protein n=1 Tax=Mycena pura TaxID=153505 RepID=A0AAD6YS30_9AGAR|nr:hypothetical protein GGX14DRAFT_611536 [Mycena pura]
MAGTAEVTGPQYISSHSADVILSDIRPIKLTLEALRSINVLLDEFLFNILSSARSLSTDKLRASLLSILPTSLGKEALLEAEVELRAYWDRTPRPAVLEDDSENFNLQWAFELLRLKCEAYCTLNESDEDSTAIARLSERMTQLGGTTPPFAALIAPASLYLTAILESICEHILSNVGRVAARDSSRTSATVQDVFVALCEDHAIYALFKSMRGVHVFQVYQQIELLTQAPKPRRSKSFSRNDRSSLSRNSPNQDLSSGHDSSMGHRSRGSTDMTSSTSITTITTPASGSTSRSSFDKARKKLMPASRSSNEDGQNGHKRSESVLSDETKQTLAAYNRNEVGPEDSALEKEFDNLMRSGSTMKVSLTPDRLKTMEVYKQEKDQRGNRRPAPLAIGQVDHPESSSNPPSRANGRRPSLRPVDSIVEEEVQPKSTPTPRKNHNITSPNLPSTSTTSVSSTSNSSASRVPRKSSRSNLSSATSPPSEASPPLPMAHAKRSGGPRGFNEQSNYPVKTRRVQRNRESLDLDDVMGGSDDEDEPAPAPVAAPRSPSAAAPRTPSKAVSTPKRSPPHAVSQSTRDLMDFLDDGPPGVPKLSASGRDMVDFLGQGPPDDGVTSTNGASTIENGKKGSGRLQRMISKLAMGTSERSRSQPSEDLGRGRGSPTVRTTGQGLTHQTSYMANRPVPPRPPPVQPISPPSSPLDDDYSQPLTRSRKASATQPTTPKRVMSTWEQQMADGQSPPVPTKGDHIENGNGVASVSGNGHSRANGYTKNGNAEEETSPRPNKLSEPSKRGVPKATVQMTSPPSSAPRQLAVTASAPVSPLVVEDQARDMRRLLAKATSADECRLILDMFLAKSGIAPDVPYPSPSSLSDAQATHERDRGPAEAALELALVELFLGGETLQQGPPPRNPRSKKRSEAAHAAAPTAAVADMPAEPRKYPAALETPLRTHTQATVSEVGA